MSETHSISVVTRLQDNGDGGYTLRAYNNEAELINDHPKFREFDPVNKKFYRREPTPKEIQDILNEDDPYENGYIGSDTIEIEIDECGARLSKPLSFHAGQ